MKFVLALLFFLPLLCMAATPAPPFLYDLHLVSIPGKSTRTMICFHGYGANYQIAQRLKDLGIIDETLVSFNFPDHDITATHYDPQNASFGTIKELLPALYVLKLYVIDKGLDSIDLFGFSAGGGAVINAIAILNSSTYNAELKTIGIGVSEKEKILKAIQKGLVILDVPLKSVEEIIDLRGSTPELEILAKSYRENNLRPIDSIELLKNLSLDILVNFQNPDEIIFNRDDAIFIERLKKANSNGTTSVVIGKDGGHLGPHTSLWKLYLKKMQEINKVSYITEKQPKKYVVGTSVKTSNAQFETEALPVRNQFLEENLAAKIPNRTNKDILCVYTKYEGDYTKPFTYMIGCEVSDLNNIPDGMRGIEIPASKYAVFSTAGEFPLSMLHAWQLIWNSDIKRSYSTDFEVYGPEFNPQQSPVVKIYIGVMS